MNHFKRMCKSKEKNVKMVQRNEEEISMDVFSLKKRNANGLLKIRINNVLLNMQLDTGSDLTFIPSNFWRKLRNPRLKKNLVQLNQFDGSVIETVGYFEADVEVKNKFDVLPVIVAYCEKNHGLIENDVLNINVIKLVNKFKAEGTEL